MSESVSSLETSGGGMGVMMLTDGDIDSVVFNIISKMSFSRIFLLSFFVVRKSILIFSLVSTPTLTYSS